MTISTMPAMRRTTKPAARAGAIFDEPVLRAVYSDAAKARNVASSMVAVPYDFIETMAIFVPLPNRAAMIS